MLETWLSKERLLSNSTPRFLTDDEESREQPSSVRQCSRPLLVWFLGPIINTSVFSEFSIKKLYVIQFCISTMHSTRAIQTHKESSAFQSLKQHPDASHRMVRTAPIHPEQA